MIKSLHTDISSNQSLDFAYTALFQKKKEAQGLRGLCSCIEFFVVFLQSQGVLSILQLFHWLWVSCIPVSGS